MKRLVYRIEVEVEPATAEPKALIEALSKAGAKRAEIVWSGMRKVES